MIYLLFATLLSGAVMVSIIVWSVTNLPKLQSWHIIRPLERGVFIMPLLLSYRDGGQPKRSDSRLHEKPTMDLAGGSRSFRGSMRLCSTHSSPSIPRVPSGIR